MKYERLGGSGLKVPRICLGTNNFGTDASAVVARNILDAAFDAGVCMVDTANIYTAGKSEEIIGGWAEQRRDDVIIATKVGMEQSDNPSRMGLSRSNILCQVERSLRRLKTDYIDLYYMHQFDSETPLEESLTAFEDLIRLNKVRYVACSNFDANQLREVERVTRELGLTKMIALQSRFNLLQRDIEKDVIPYCQEHALGVLTYSPLRSGLLSGKYSFDMQPPPGSRAANRAPDYWKRLNKKEDFDRIEKFKQIANREGVSLPVLSIAWILNRPGITSAVVGASNPGQFRDCIQAAELALSDTTMRELDQIS
jgi:1-deoxyxylulose-5-phosphate synthase